LVKCDKCGFDNPSNLKFCGNCGARLNVTVVASRFEGLALLHIVGGLYLLTSLIFNALVQASLTFIIPYLTSGLLGLYAGYKLYMGRTGKHLKIASALAVILGLASTLLLFWIGLGVRGVVGPAWIIFSVNAWILWKEKARL
jgi:hypothetical protein